MNLTEHPVYINDLTTTITSFKHWDLFKNKSFLISGASGMIGSFLVDLLMYQNIHDNLNCKIFGLGRDQERAKKRFIRYWKHPNFSFIAQDLNNNEFFLEEPVDFVLHLASNTHPVYYSNFPVETILTNVVGTNNLLNWASENNVKRFLFASSVEIYGENKGDVEDFKEDYLGYIDCNTLRAGYPESKRVGESLCQAYIKQKKLDVVIARLCRTYGPTMLFSDSKAHAQFIRNGINKENIILKSEGKQYYSYLYVADAVLALLIILSKAENGQAYNVSDEKSNITLTNFASIVAKIAKANLVYDLPNEIEKAGYSKATKATLNSDRLKALGFTANFDIDKGIHNTLYISQDMDL